MTSANAASLKPAADGTIQRYLLRLLVVPLGATLGVVLVSLLLERLLRLFDLLAGAGGGAGPIVQLLLFLVPHYLGLALPAAVFLAVYVVVARLSRGNEMDALQAAGFSLARLSRPFLAVGVLAAVFGILLHGWLQPIGRYGYRAAFHTLTHAGWNARLPPGEFVPIGSRVTVRIDAHDLPGGALRGIFVHERGVDGTDIVTTAPRGRMALDPRASELILELDGGTRVTVHPDGRTDTLAFDQVAQARPFLQRLPMFRLRGADERELTLPELWHASTDPDPPVPQARIRAELNGRLVRAASLPLLPLLAMPMGLGAKRAGRSAGILVACVILVVYQQIIQSLESLGDAGRIDPLPALWLAFAGFAVLATLVFRQSHRHPEEGAFDGPLAAVDRGLGALGRLVPGRS